MNIVEHRSGAWSPGLSDAERETLFRVAIDTLDWCVRGERTPFTFQSYPVTPRIETPTATFVTLKMHGMLRGCIGSLAPTAPMIRSVHENAVNAALRDFRFRPVTPRELPRLDVDISILSPIRSVPSAEDFTIGEHGIIVEKHGRSAVYLPEVAVEQGWDRDQTLSSLCEKAGLPHDAWRDGARFKVFSSVVLTRDNERG